MFLCLLLLPRYMSEVQQRPYHLNPLQFVVIDNPLQLESALWTHDLPHFLLLAGTIFFYLSVTDSVIMSSTLMIYRGGIVATFKDYYCVPVMLFPTKLASIILNRIPGSWGFKARKSSSQSYSCLQACCLFSPFS